MLLFLVLGCSREQRVKPTNTAVTNIAAHPYYGPLVDHVSFPSATAMSHQKCSHRHITVAVSNLSILVKDRLRLELQPLVEIDAVTEGIRNYKDGNDYLFARYMTRSGYRVTVQDGLDLFVFIEPMANSIDHDLVQHVRSVVMKAVAYPSGLITNGNLRVGAVPLEADRGRAGSALYKGSPEALDAWYDDIGWWSDGTNVLLQISKLTESDYKYRNLEARSSVIRKPRKFSEEKLRGREAK